MTHKAIAESNRKVAIAKTAPKARKTRSAGLAEIVCDDCESGLNRVADGTAQLILTSPPYNIGKEYEQDKKLTLDEYLAWLEPVVNLVCRKISDSGSVCWQVGNYVKDGQVFPLDYYFYQMFVANGFKLRNRIIWHFNFGLHATNRLSGRYETILWFTKSDNFKFNLDPVRVPQMYPGKTHSKSKGEKAGRPSGNPKGKNPSDFWEFDAGKALLDEAIWEIPNVKSNHPEKTIHPCQFPTELAERCVLAFTDEGDLVVDPFVGAGTTVIAAVKHGRKGIGVDKSATYAKVARQRLKLLEEGKLKLRTSGKSVRKPRSGEKVASIPKEWQE